MRNYLFFFVFASFCAHAQENNLNLAYPHHSGPPAVIHAPTPPFSRDTAGQSDTAISAFLLNYDSADAEVFDSVNITARLHSISNHYIQNQWQLMNNYYSYPSDTTGSYKLSPFSQNYNCINSITVAFDSLFDPYDSNTTSYNNLASILIADTIDTIYIPIMQVNHSDSVDTVEIQLNPVDNYGYPISLGNYASTMIIAKNPGDTGSITTELRMIKWKANFGLPGGVYKFSVTVTYYGQKQDSCWFSYGYGFCRGVCPDSTNLALNTHYTPIVTPSTNMTANSFALWNQYLGYGLLPTETNTNAFYNCDSGKTYKDSVDGANYLQNIDIYALFNAYVPGFNAIHAINSPVVFLQNAPNPFNGQTTISYKLNSSSEVDLTITDIYGRKIMETNLGKQQTGIHTYLFNANDLPAGIYFYSLQSNGFIATKPMALVK
jgi:hypothetical protein